MNSQEFPTYEKVLSSFERSIVGNVGWACSCYGEDKEFDESFNHKRYDELGIPRKIQQPITFEI